MAWTARQLAMLDEMGIRLWLSPAGDAAGAGAPHLPAGAQHSSPAGSQHSSPAGAPQAPTAPRARAPVAESPVAVRSRVAGVESMDWPELRAAVESCTACALCESRRNTVFGVGNQRAHWMIVGEAPGEQEDARGEPFVGKAGQLLDNMLRAIGLTREAGPPERQVYIANTLKCRPPGNRNPEPHEMNSCEPFLARQLALIGPRIIVAMGRFAVQSLLRSSEPVGRLRGRVHQWQGVPLIVTYHPAYLLRNPQDKARAWEDLCLARSVLERATAGGP